ncbi:LysR family transcriptional regulator [Celeribacter marinus]|uniref:Hydrogen peroxide-inducible activator n=1 Tax=Celeribacter marinus TaxID=1397108 RepID=A0A0P0ADW9_9RHOB|nr:LysR family transcriptional regulator [Celeribacter marinus]ALI56690.1 Hydrogen peroxide-inducible activator [Celeribacter marinus]SFK63085.1 DNA-binding transcriptional regulator, LysR family [Celeribacter marinus]
MIDKLEMFMAVARAGHFGRAAKTLGITQPTLSAGIKQLEDQLGVTLILRGSRFGGLTPEGQRALHWAQRIVADTQQLRAEMHGTGAELSGQIRLAAIPSALTWAARLAAQMRKNHPNVRVTILSRTSLEILDMMEAHDIDAGLTYLDNEPLGDVVVEPIYIETPVAVTRADTPLAARPDMAWSDFDGLAMCLLTADMQGRRIIDAHFQNSGVTPDVRLESNSTVVLTRTVQETGWVTILSWDLATFLCAGTALKIIPITPQSLGQSVGLAAPRRASETPVLTALMAAAAHIATSKSPVTPSIKPA